MMIRGFRSISMTDTMAQTKLGSIADICLGGKSYRSEHHAFGNDLCGWWVRTGMAARRPLLHFSRLPQTYTEIVRQFQTRLSFEPHGA